MNRTTRTIIAILGIPFALAGMDHGFFETLQGYTRTPGLIIQAIGPANRMWVHGTEEALTIVPNFLVTGLLAITVSLAILVWSISFVQRPGGSWVYILLFVLLVLVGGGIGQVVFFIPAWLVATRIHSSLGWWQKVLPRRLQSGLGKLWPASLAAGCVAFLIALEIAVVGYVPGVSAEAPELLLGICWSFLLAALLLFLFTFVAGFANDLHERVGVAAHGGHKFALA